MRQKGLFKKMRDYENVQLQLYLHALQIPMGFLVEAFTNKKNEITLHTHEVVYDNEYVNEVILERLKVFTKYFKELMQEPSRKENLLKGSKTEYSKYQEIYLGIETIDF
jgi:hypothetical protein